MSRSKAIGTAVESATVKEFLAHGIHATRPALRGAGDVGDVHVAYGRAVIECKGGEAAHSASWNLLAAWWQETEAEAARVTECDLAVLVVKRKGSGKAQDWRAFLRIDEYLWVTKALELDAPRVVEMPLGGLIADLAAAGWAGDV